MRWGLAAAVLFGGLLLSGRSSAENSGQLWVAAGLAYEPSKPLALQLEQQIRVEDNFTRPGEFLTTLSAEYRLLRWWSLAAGYRLTLVREPDRGSVQHRFHLDSKLRLKLKPLRLKYRLRGQQRIRNKKSGGIKLKHVVRNLVGVQWRMKVGLRPYLSTENFLRVDSDDVRPEKQRVSVGTTWSHGAHGFDLGYRLELPFGDEGDLRHIIVLGYQHTLIAVGRRAPTRLP